MFTFLLVLCMQAGTLKQAIDTGDLPSLQAILGAGVNVNQSLIKVFFC